MTAVFDDVRLPEEVEQGSTGGPSFNTSIVRMSNGAETRNQNWQSQKMVYDVGYGITSSAEDTDDTSNFYAVMEFFYARRGRFRGFRFKDWTDYQAFAEPCATTAVATVLQLQKTYTSGGIAYSRLISRPVADSVVMLSAGGTILDPSTWTVDTTTGLVTFTSAPSSGTVATFEFDVPVRFDTDVFTLTVELFNAAQIQSLNIVEL